MRYNTFSTGSIAISSRSISKTLRATGAAAALTVMAVASASASPILINGSLTGPVGINNVPPGWTPIETPDTTDENFNPATLQSIAPMTASPDGGTWAGLANYNFPGFFRSVERISQVVSGFDVGTSYTLKWYNANFGATDLGRVVTEASAIEVLMDGAHAGTGSILAVGSNWVEDSLVFVATTGTIEFGFQTFDTATRSYQSIDGIRLSETNPPANAVPEPASLSLFGLAGMGLLAARRRKQKASA